MSEKTMKECKRCNKSTSHEQVSAPIGIHILLTLLTFGIWIFFWVFNITGREPQYRCIECGSVNK